MEIIRLHANNLSTDAADELFKVDLLSRKKFSLPFEGNARWSERTYHVNSFYRFKDEIHDVAAGELASSVLVVRLVPYCEIQSIL